MRGWVSWNISLPLTLAPMHPYHDDDALQQEAEGRVNMAIDLLATAPVAKLVAPGRAFASRPPPLHLGFPFLPARRMALGEHTEWDHLALQNLVAHKLGPHLLLGGQNGPVPSRWG